MRALKFAVQTRERDESTKIQKVTYQEGALQDPLTLF